MAPQRLTLFCSLLLIFSTAAFGQKQDPQAAAALSSPGPGYLRVAPRSVHAFQPGQLTIGSGTVLDAKTGAALGGSANLQSNVQSSTSAAGTIDGLDTIRTFDGAFAAQAGPDSGNLFRFTMIGNHPLAGQTTRIPAEIAEVSLTLLNEDGTTLATVPFGPFESLTLQSPNFESTNYRSGDHIQFADAVQRAEFFNRMAPNWHTVLKPSVVDRVNIVVPRFVNLQLANGTVIQARSYFIGTAADGSTFVLMLDALFNFYFGNIVVGEINAGNFTTDGLSMTLFPNTFLFSLNTVNPKAPGDCCVLGFHTYFLDPSTTPQPRWITQYASWISPGLFGPGVQDVTALSHETSEAFNDPFVDNITPLWQFPGVPPTAKVCQGNLETGDPLEVLPTGTVPIMLKNRGTPYTFHPQIEALLQWFEMGQTSNAIDGAFSFPDESVLTHSALPCPQ
jgi:hypothetical protein